MNLSVEKPQRCGSRVPLKLELGRNPRKELAPRSLLETALRRSDRHGVERQGRIHVVLARFV